MPTGNVTTTHQDGGLGQSVFTADRIHTKIGRAETGTENQIYLILNLAQAKTIFGAGELVDEIEHHFEEFNEAAGEIPQPVLAIRPTNDLAGSIDAPVKGTGNTGTAANPATDGTPTGDRTVVLKFTKAGAHGTAEYRRSTDGGATFEAPIVTPATNTPISLAVGATATFVDAVVPANTFQVGDTWTFVIKGPTASYAAKLAAAVACVREYRQYFGHVIGGVKRSFAVSLQTILADMEAAHHPCFFVLEEETFEQVMPQGTPETEANVKAYFQKLADEWDPFTSVRTLIVPSQAWRIPGGIAAYGSTANALDAGVGGWRSAATFLCARMAAGPVNQSTAWVKVNKSLTFAKIRFWDLGYRDYMDVLHDLGHTVLKQYDDYDGVFIARDRLKAPGDSDFQEAPERRRADKVHRIAYQTSLPYLNADSKLIDLTLLTTICEGEVLRQMVKPGAAEISGVKIIFDPEKKFSATGILDVDLVMFIGQRMKQIRWRTSFAPAA